MHAVVFLRSVNRTYAMDLAPEKIGEQNAGQKGLFESYLLIRPIADTTLPCVPILMHTRALLPSEDVENSRTLFLLALPLRPARLLARPDTRDCSC